MLGVGWKEKKKKLFPIWRKELPLPLLWTLLQLLQLLLWTKVGREGGEENFMITTEVFQVV